jgi:hypothetical protein
VEPDAVATAYGAPAATSVVFGGHTGRNALYLAFDPTWKASGDVEAAFLLLDPSPGTAPDRGDVQLEVWTVGEPWTAERVAAGTRPSLEPPRASGILRPYPPGVVRIDVTDVARALARKERDDGIAVVAAGTGGEGVAVSAGTAGGAPRLELYLGRPSSHAW